MIVTTRRNQSTALPARAAHAASSLLLGQRWKEGLDGWRGGLCNQIFQVSIRNTLDIYSHVMTVDQSVIVVRPFYREIPC